MPKFLEQVARHFIEKHENMSDWTLVFPNKRSAMFLKKYMQELLVKTSARPRFMPRFVTMGNFVSRFASRPEMPRLEQLFLLYDCYRSLLSQHGRDEQLRDFDKFIFWGGMILDDFDDVDRQLVDAGKLFKNLKDLKEINADYLDDEQKKLVRQIWGETPRTAAVTEFWAHVTHDNEDSPEASFISLWELLGELYPAFKKALHERGSDTSGGQFRDAALAISSSDTEILRNRHYAFIGFNDLSHSETLMMKKLKDAGCAKFFWDFDTPLLNMTHDERMLSIIRRLKQSFPMPEDFETENPESLPDIEVVAVPSCIAQAKSVSDILDRWNKEGLINYSNAIDTAVVLPDENLLMPLLLSIPDSIPSVNITMGISFASTPFASMLHSIISMQLRAREIHGKIHYYYADVIELLSHPHIQVIAPATAEKIKKDVSRNNLFNIDAKDLCMAYPEVAFLFSPVKGNGGAAEVCRYMLDLIEGLATALKQNGRPSQGGLPELEMLDYFHNELDNLHSLIDKYCITMSENTYFALFERLMQSRMIDLQGTPLRGLQIMGVLETRAIDFDNIVILSMNENVFPRKSYMRTMIPNNLRIGYGMSTIDRQDSLYTYYFYRLLSRAKRVKLIYDSRTGSFGAGEASRYIAQLHHITPPGIVHDSGLQFLSDFNTPLPISIKKDPAVIEQLNKFRPGGNGYLSASALKEYKNCRLRFYLRYVRNLRGEDDITDYISPAIYGTIVHKIVETLYSKYEGQAITHEIISGILDTPGLLESVINNTVFDLYYRNSKYTTPELMPAEGTVTCSVIGIYVRKMLELEREQCAISPFKFIKGEMEVKSPPAWKINDKLSVNFKMSIDRVDEIAPGYLRFIDYKTGADKVEPAKMDNLFKRERHDDNAIFQLMTYCVAYKDLVNADCAIKPLVYPFRIIASTGNIPDIVIDSRKVDDYRQLEEEFRQQLFSMIDEIFAEDADFDQASDPASCTFCPFLDLCGRTPSLFQ